MVKLMKSGNSNVVTVPASQCRKPVRVEFRVHKKLEQRLKNKRKTSELVSNPDQTRPDTSKELQSITFALHETNSRLLEMSKRVGNMETFIVLIAVTHVIILIGLSYLVAMLL